MAISINWPLLLVIFEVAVGLGMVIFVHELGHFAVAKLCGVKCEKFYLGFDIAGLKLCKFTWGETEYGIGILPLGGYVKMLGQEDNPARLREEIERAKQKQAAGETAEPSPQNATAEAQQPQAAETKRQTSEAEHSRRSEIDVEAAERVLFDPRSYLAQSVPKRMGIISAGVIMNVVFAFVIAVIAYRMGVKQVTCGVGHVFPGEAAWKAGLRVGDKIEMIGDQKVKRFRDLQKNVSLGDIDQGVKMDIRRPDPADPGTFKKPDIPPIVPDRIRVVPTIGIGGPMTTTLYEKDKPVVPGSPAAEAKPGFQSGDTIVKIAKIDEEGVEGDGQRVESYAQFQAYLARNPGETLAITVERPTETEGEETEATEKITINVAPNPMRRLGLIMEMGEICAIQAGSPADYKDIRPGDQIIKIDFNLPGQPAAEGSPKSPLDPITLPQRLRKLAGKRIRLYLERDGKKLDPIDVTLRRANWYETPVLEDHPMTAPALGIAYRVCNRVAKVLPGSPAANEQGRIQEGDEILEATLLPPDAKTIEKYEGEQEEQTIEFDQGKQNWPVFMTALQQSLPGTRVRLQYVGKGKESPVHVTITLKPTPLRQWSVPSQQWFDPDRGLRFEQATFIRVADSWGEALRLGGEETVESLTMVVQILRKIGTQISPKAFGGPGTIAAVAGHAAQEGIAKLLIFLTILSANLAIINFLPIPLLDGGHMVFLVWEGIRGKPADERVQLVLTYLGLIFILGLMAWVIGLDVYRLMSTR